MDHVSSEAVYFARRARQSHIASTIAEDVGPASIHASLASAYDRLAQTAASVRTAEDERPAIDVFAAEVWDIEGGAAGDQAP